MPGMNERQERELAEGLRALAETTRHASASPRVADAILAEMRHPRGRRLPAAYRLLPIAAAFVLAVAGAIWLAQRETRDVPQVIRPAGFVALPQADALPDIESASIVRVSLPVAALPAYGVAILPEMTAERVEADLLVAQDGQPRAIRLVYQSSTMGSTP